MNYEQRMKIIAAAIAAETAVTIDKNLEKGSWTVSTELIR